MLIDRRNAAKFGLGRRIGRRMALALCTLATVSTVLGQGTGNSPSTGTPVSDDKPVAIDALPPNLRLGVRVSFVARQIPTIPMVVLVPDGASFAAAVSKWRVGDKGTSRFPVLIDDGSYAAHARISRFVRAFQPQGVVRWAATGESAKWPVQAVERQSRVAAALAEVWGAPKPDLFNTHLKSKGFVPPGVVVANANDPAWTAALTVAAAHGQPLIWLDYPQFNDPASYSSLAPVDEFNERLMRAVAETGFAYDKLGDDIEGVTLCMTTPSKVFLGEGNKNRYYALTDLLGRKGENAKRARWGWAGQIMSDESAAAYSAMSAVFLLPETAWLFDGYGDTEPWVKYDMTKVADELKRGKVASILDDDLGGRGLIHLRIRAAGSRARGADATSPGFGVDAGLVGINTMGNADFFDLAPGQAKPGDFPMMRQPTIACIVHSFSAQSPTARWSFGGVVLERGAYAYAGSVDEPYLQGFVPTPMVMRRLMQGLPWGVAPRFDDGPIWKIAVYGDPLMHFGPRGPRMPATNLPLDDVKDLAAGLPDLLKNRDLTQAVLTLSLLGRDKDAARLIAATAKDQPEVFTPDLALAGVNAAYFAGDLAALTAALEKIGPVMLDTQRVKKEGLAEIRDMAWHALGPETPALTRREGSALVWYLRPETLARDIDEAIRRVEPSRGHDAEAVVREMAARVKAANK